MNDLCNETLIGRRVMPPTQRFSNDDGDCAEIRHAAPPADIAPNEGGSVGVAAVLLIVFFLVMGVVFFGKHWSF